MTPYKAASHVCICEVHFHGKDGEIRRVLAKNLRHFFNLGYLEYIEVVTMQL